MIIWKPTPHYQLTNPMQRYIKHIVLLVIVVAVVALVALLWPRPCTPDVECADYDDFISEINAR